MRCFKLGREDRLRDLDPNDINKLVSIKGMVTRTSSVMPDLYMAFFECSICSTPQEVFISRGEIAEPQVCGNTSCQAKQAMQLVHNRSKFSDKQIVRIQEAPEHIPEGETPQTCSMCAWEGLVDTAKPGDRVEVTGVYRAVPLRVNPRQRTVRLHGCLALTTLARTCKTKADYHRRTCTRWRSVRCAAPSRWTRKLGQWTGGWRRWRRRCRRRGLPSRAARRQLLR